MPINVKEIKTYEIEADADIFIVPNPMRVVDSELLNKIGVKKFLKFMLDNCGHTDILDSKLVDVWWVSKDFNSVNIRDHGFVFTDPAGDNIYVFNGPELMSSIPMNMLNDMTEGSSKTFVFEFYISGSCARYLGPKSIIPVDNIMIRMILHATASQEKYRYNSFGRFETVLNSMDNMEDFVF